MMNLTLTNLNQPAAASKSAAPAANDAAAPAALDAAGATPPVDAQQTPQQPAFAFAQWLGLGQMTPPDVDTVAVTAPDAAPAEAETPTGEQQQQVADAPLLGAMTMSIPLIPLMPLMPLMPIGQAALAAVVAAQPGVPAAMKESAPAADTQVSLSAAAGSASREEREGRVRLAAMPAAAPALPIAGAAQAAPVPVAAAPTGAAAASAAPAAPAAETLASKGEAPQDAAAPVTERGAANTAGVAAPAPAGTQRTADTVTLAGPPTAWRQTLQDALGERLQLQVGKNAEQAVIRLEPPMLGRVEIAIRHSAGALEVHISATHGEVLRQLQSVSEGLRNDLAQRQFTDVSVNIVQAPRGPNGAQMFAGGDGRGRQQDGRQAEQQPGDALAEANAGTSPFSLNGRG